MIDSLEHLKRIVNCPIFRFSLRVNVSIPFCLSEILLLTEFALVKVVSSGPESRRVAICCAMQQFRKALGTHCLHEQRGLLIAFFQT